MNQSTTPRPVRLWAPSDAITLDLVESDRWLRRAAVVSILLNVLVFTLFARFLIWSDPFPKEKISSTERITIERLVHRVPRKGVAARPARAPKVALRPAIAAPPTPVAVATPAPVLAAPPIGPHAVSTLRPIVHAPARPAAVAYAPQPPERHEVPPVTAAGSGRLSEHQLAAITQSLGDDIARDRDRENPLRVDPTAAAQTGEKHYGPDLSELTAGGVGHNGLCYPIKSWTEDGWDYYYVACNVRATDGTFDREDVPWPVRYRPSHDPNLGTAREEPIAMPLPGWHLPAGESVADGVRQYALEHGVSL